MSRVALVVQMDMKPEHRDEFIAIMRKHAENCLAVEEGCVYFDVALSRDHDNRLVLYEVYRDQAAWDDHAASPHLAKTRESYEGMLAGRERMVVDIF
jgi:autoinducer 2-degrading protein